VRDEHDSAIHRIEAFSDGVFAIAITLLILEIGVPAVSGNQTLKHELLRLWPKYAAYALSFAMIGIYWANHNSLFRLFARADHTFLMLNVFFLLAIAFLPFPTAVLGDYLRDSDQRQTAAIFYAIGLLLPASGWFAVWVYALRSGLLVPNLDPHYLAIMTWQYVISIALYVTAAFAALQSPWLGLAICVGLTMLYLLPPRQPVYLSGNGSSAS
jgi:uncharacterized membrane protein